VCVCVCVCVCMSACVHMCMAFLQDYRLFHRSDHGRAAHARKTDARVPGCTTHADTQAHSAVQQTTKLRKGDNVVFSMHRF